MTKEDLVRAAVEAAGEALEELFPGVEFHITARGENGQVDQPEPVGAEAPADKSAFFGNLIGISRLMEAVEEKAPQALKTAAAKVSMYRNMCGELMAACAEPASQDEPEDQIDEMLKYIFADEQNSSAEDETGDDGVCLCGACDGHDDCSVCEGCDICEATDHVDMDYMVNIRFGDDLNDVQMDVCGFPDETKLAAALLKAALYAMPDYPDEKWQNFCDLLDELAWMLAETDS